MASDMEKRIIEETGGKPAEEVSSVSRSSFLAIASSSGSSSPRPPGVATPAKEALADAAAPYFAQSSDAARPYLTALLTRNHPHNDGSSKRTLSLLVTYGPKPLRPASDCWSFVIGVQRLERGLGMGLSTAVAVSLNASLAPSGDC